MEIELHQLEESTSSIEPERFKKNSITETIICSFKTERVGVVRVIGLNVTKEGERNTKNIDMVLATSGNEPEINVLTESEQAYVKKYMTAVLLLTFYPHELVN